MKAEKMVDLIQELIVVETDVGFIVSSGAVDNETIFSTSDNENFKVTVTKL